MTDRIFVRRVQSESDRIAELLKPPQNASVMTLSDRVRARLREALDARHLSQRAIADRLAKFTGETWSQPRVGKVLNGRVELKVEDVALLAGLAGLSIVELFREPGKEFVADLTPTELRILTAMRENVTIFQHIRGLIDALTDEQPKRKHSHAVIRERMRRGRQDE